MDSPGNLPIKTLPVDYAVRTKLPVPNKPAGELLAELYQGYNRVWVIDKIEDGTNRWFPPSEYNQLPPDFKQIYYKVVPSNDQGLLAFALYSREGQNNQNNIKKVF